MDIIDLQLRYFDYIRIGKSTHDFRLFKKVFLNKTRWEDFNTKVQDTVNSAAEKLGSIDEYRRQHPEETEDTISVLRNNDFREKTEKALNQLYGDEKAFIVSKESEETPLKIAQQAYQKLDKLSGIIDLGVDRIVDLDELLAKVKDIQKLVGKIKMKID